MGRFGDSAHPASWRAAARGITNPPSNINPAGRGRALSGLPPPWPNAPKPQGAPRAPTWVPNSSACADAAAMPRHARPSSTRSSCRLPRARPTRPLPRSRCRLVPASPPRSARPPPGPTDRSTRIPRHHRTHRPGRLNQLNRTTPGCETASASGHLVAQVTYVFGSGVLLSGLPADLPVQVGLCPPRLMIARVI